MIIVLTWIVRNIKIIKIDYLLMSLIATINIFICGKNYPSGFEPDNDDDDENKDSFRIS